MRGIAMVLLLAGCPDRSAGGDLVPVSFGVENKDVPINLNRNLDLLFMIDDSSSMASKQQHLKDSFPGFIDHLEHITGGLPSLHIGVVSSDLGDGGFAGCAPGNGDDGRLQNAAHGACTGPSAPYIVDLANPDGTRTVNFDPAQGLAGTFSCIAALGTSGCGFEQPIGSVARALDPTNLYNDGFLRDDAFLGIIFVTDEDDCTADDPSLFDPANTSLGPLASFRCTRYGVQCDQDTSAIGVKSNCTENTDDRYFAQGIDRKVDAIKALKPNPDKDIEVAAIMAPPTPVDVEPAPGNAGDPGSPFLEPSCQASFGHGDPGVRLDYFLNQFAQHTETSVCDDSYQPGLQQIAQVIKEAIGLTCLAGDLEDIDPDTDGVQPDCAVWQVANGTQEVFPQCDASHSVTPCWWVEPDRSHCQSTPTQLSMSFDYAAASIDAHVRAQCVLDGT